MAQNVVLSVLCRDRVGIIASVTRAIQEMRGSIDAISQTVMRGYFTIIFTIRFEESLPIERIAATIEAEGESDELHASVQEWKPDAPPALREGGSFVITITGKDQPGIINRISTYLASRNINILDLTARAEGEQFVLIGQVMMPPELDVHQVSIDLETLWPERNITARLQHENIFKATNEVEFHHARTQSREA